MNLIVSDNLVGTTVRVLTRHDELERARGLVRVVGLDHGTFVFLLQSADARDSYFHLAKGEFFEVSTHDESVHIVADVDAKLADDQKVQIIADMVMAKRYAEARAVILEIEEQATAELLKDTKGST